MAFNQGCKGLVPRSSDTDPRFLRYVLQATTAALEAQANGTTFSELSGHSLAAIRIPWPDQREQRAIANYLEQETAEIDTLLDDFEELNQILHEEREARVAHDVRGLASNFSTTRLKNLADVTVGIVVNPSSYYAPSGVPTLRGLNVEPGRIRLDDVVFISDEAHKMHSKSKLTPGDVVVVRTGQAGRAAVVPSGLYEANAVDLLIIRPSGRLNPGYLTALLNSHYIVDLIRSQTVGAIQSHYNVESLRNLEIPAPEPATQQSFFAKWREKTTDVDAALADLKSVQRLARERRSALISAAVTGQIDVTQRHKPVAEQLEEEVLQKV